MSSESLRNQFERETLNQLLSALSNESNRYVVEYFCTASENVASLEELAEYTVGKHETAHSASSQRVDLDLHHSGLPKLAAVGILDYDPRSKTVRWLSHSIVDVDFNHVLEVERVA